MICHYNLIAIVNSWLLITSQVSRKLQVVFPPFRNILKYKQAFEITEIFKPEIFKRNPSEEHLYHKKSFNETHQSLYHMKNSK